MRTASTSSEFSGKVVERFPQRILNCMIGWSGYDRIRTLLTLRMPLKQMRAVFQKLKHRPFLSLSLLITEPEPDETDLQSRHHRSRRRPESRLHRSLRLCPPSDVFRRARLLFGTPLALGSWWGLIVFIPMTLVIVWRFLDEEKFLLRNLA